VSTDSAGDEWIPFACQRFLQHLCLARRFRMARMITQKIRLAGCRVPHTSRSWRCVCSLYHHEQCSFRVTDQSRTKLTHLTVTPLSVRLSRKLIHPHRRRLSGAPSFMMDFWRSAIRQQFHAAIDMLGNAIEACPDSVWSSQAPRAFWYLAFHTPAAPHIALFAMCGFSLRSSSAGS